MKISEELDGNSKKTLRCPTMHELVKMCVDSNGHLNAERSTLVTVRLGTHFEEIAILVKMTAFRQMRTRTSNDTMFP